MQRYPNRFGWQEQSKLARREPCATPAGLLLVLRDLAWSRLGDPHVSHRHGYTATGKCEGK